MWPLSGERQAGKAGEADKATEVNLERGPRLSTGEWAGQLKQWIQSSEQEGEEEEEEEKEDRRRAGEDSCF